MSERRAKQEPSAPPRKSTVDEIRRRFDGEVERFARLETGQEATVDAVLAMDLVTAAAAAAAPGARSVLDIGCGAGNYTLKLLERAPGLDVTLLDLSRPMLDRARQRIEGAASGTVTCLEGDVRDLELGVARFDIILAAAVLHHLRAEAEWRAVLAKLHRALVAGGSLWVFDLVASDIAAVESLMAARYGAYLEARGGVEHRQRVFAYIEAEDSPRSLVFQLDLLRAVGFAGVDVLHKSSCFAAFGALKAPSP